MISPRHNAIFLHIGKTAGTSVERLLVPVRFEPTRKARRFMFGYDADEGIYLHHATCATMRRLLGAQTFDACYKFTVVREPYARLLSVFNYHCLAHGIEASGFRDYVLALPDYNAHPVRRRGSHTLPQVDYTQIDGRTVVDHVARFEDLPGSLEPVRERLGITRELTHVNAHARPPQLAGLTPARAYDDEMVAVMRAVYAADFAAFGYPEHPGDPA